MLGRRVAVRASHLKTWEVQKIRGAVDIAGYIVGSTFSKRRSPDCKEPSPLVLNSFPAVAAGRIADAELSGSSVQLFYLLRPLYCTHSAEVLVPPNIEFMKLEAR